MSSYFSNFLCFHVKVVSFKMDYFLEYFTIYTFLNLKFWDKGWLQIGLAELMGILHFFSQKKWKNKRKQEERKSASFSVLPYAFVSHPAQMKSMCLRSTVSSYGRDSLPFDAMKLHVSLQKGFPSFHSIIPSITFHSFLVETEKRSNTHDYSWSLNRETQLHH